MIALISKLDKEDEENTEEYCANESQPLKQYE